MVKEIGYKRLVSRKRPQYLQPRTCRSQTKDDIPLKPCGINHRGHRSHRGYRGHRDRPDVCSLVAKPGTYWSKCKDQVMSLFKYLFRDDVVTVVVGKSRFDSERSPVPYRTQSVLVSKYNGVPL